jgi:arylsulfatase A-like enzyme
LFAEVLDVPLIMRFPDRRPPRRVEPIVDQIDFMPTLLDYLGIEARQAVQGRSFLPLCDGTSQPEWSKCSIAYLHLRGRVATSYLDSSWKLILKTKGERIIPRVYDSRLDRAEKRNLAKERPDLVEELTSRLKAKEGDLSGDLLPAAARSDDDSELREQLKALGYL